jgi:alpha-glucosidase
LINPLFFAYPSDSNLFSNALQFLYGADILVSPVTEENSTSVTIYLPDDRFYAFDTWGVVEGAGAEVTLDDVDFTEIPLHVRGGAVIPLRAESALTTTEVRTKPFHLIVAPDRDGRASGKLYLDDGDSIKQPSTSEIEFTYDNGVLKVSGSFDYTAEDARVSVVKILGQEKPGKRPEYGYGGRGKGKGRGNHGRKMKKCKDDEWKFENGVVTVEVDQRLDGEFTVEI